MDRRITTFAVLAMMWLGMATVALRVVEPTANVAPKIGLQRLFAQRQFKTVAVSSISNDR